MSVRVSLRGMLRLSWVDTLRIDHNVGFLTERLICSNGNLHRKHSDIIDILFKSGEK